MVSGYPNVIHNALPLGIAQLLDKTFTFSNNYGPLIETASERRNEKDSLVIKNSLIILFIVSSTLTPFATHGLTDEETDRLLQRLNSAPTAKSHHAVFKKHSDHVLELLEASFMSNASNVTLALSSAFRARPDLAVDIAALARAYYLEPGMIANVAISAGIDPMKTIQKNNINAKQNTNTSPQSSANPPTKLTTGGNGGGGLDVISPN